jgi:hypothetical protein
MGIAVRIRTLSPSKWSKFCSVMPSIDSPIDPPARDASKRGDMRRRFANGALAILLTADACGSELVYVLRTKYVSASIRNHDGPRGLLAAHVATEHGSSGLRRSLKANNC